MRSKTAQKVQTPATAAYATADTVTSGFRLIGFLGSFGDELYTTLYL